MVKLVIIDHDGEDEEAGEQGGWDGWLVDQAEEDEQPLETQENTESNPDIHLILSSAPLLSGSGFNSLTSCQNATDSTCKGGVAAVAAYARRLPGSKRTLVVPQFDFMSPFIQQHPLGWETNRLVLQRLLGWNFFLARSWFLQTGLRDSSRQVDGLQSEDWPLLLSNVAVPPTNSWYPYTRGVYFDEGDTNLALLSLVEAIDVGGSGLHYDMLETTKTLLDHIYKINQQKKDCHLASQQKSPYELYLLQQQQNSTVGTSSNSGRGACYIPVILADLVSYDNTTATLLPLLAEYENPPALYVDYGGVNPTLSAIPKQFGSKGVWAIGFRTSSKFFQHLQLTPNNNTTTSTNANLFLSNVTFTKTDIAITGPLPAEFRDDVYNSHIETLRKYADETIANDPVIGEAGHDFPMAKANGLVACEAGECPQGNLFTDAIRWQLQADFAFANSGAYHGLGFPAGPIRVSNLWEILPFANTLCSGQMSGLSIFQLFNYSVTSATFEGADTVDGGKLLQVSGIKVVYNTELTMSSSSNSNSSRLIDLQIWNTTLESYQPLQRLQIYKFATDSYNCLFNNPFNQMTGSLLEMPGEISGQIHPELLEQEVVANFLTALGGPYDGYETLQPAPRLVNDTSAMEPLASTFVQTQGTCPPGTHYWLEELKSCFECPTIRGVSVSTATTKSDNLVVAEVEESSASNNNMMMELQGISGDPTVDTTTMTIYNQEEFPVDIQLKSIPQFLFYTGSLPQMLQQQVVTVQPGSSQTLPFGASAQHYKEGSARGEITMQVVSSSSSSVGTGGASGGGIEFAGCSGDDLIMEAVLEVLPPSQYNQLNDIRFVGFALAATVMMLAAGFGSWCLYYRDRTVVRTMQPFFLMMICSGVFIMSSALIPLSLDDEIISPEGMDKACMSIPWLLSIGFTISFSALFSKLWRINRLWKIKGSRRAVIKHRDVLAPFAVLLTCNVTVLLVWTLVDPFQFVRFAIDGEEWNTVGVCDCDATPIFASVMCLVNFGALCMACYQAYEARNIPEDFSEAGYLGMAIFSWFQIGVVGIPVLFLIEETNRSARYFVTTSLIVGVCVSLLLWIFIPLIRIWWTADPLRSSRQGQVYVSGINPSGVNISSTGVNPTAAATLAGRISSSNGDGTLNPPCHTFRLATSEEEKSCGSFADEYDDNGFEEIVSIVEDVKTGDSFDGKPICHVPLQEVATPLVEEASNTATSTSAASDEPISPPPIDANTSDEHSSNLSYSAGSEPETFEPEPELQPDEVLSLKVAPKPSAKPTTATSSASKPALPPQDINEPVNDRIHDAASASPEPVLLPPPRVATHPGNGQTSNSTLWAQLQEPGAETNTTISPPADVSTTVSSAPVPVPAPVTPVQVVNPFVEYEQTSNDGTSSAASALPVLSLPAATNLFVEVASNDAASISALQPPGATPAVHEMPPTLANPFVEPHPDTISTHIAQDKPVVNANNAAETMEKSTQHVPQIDFLSASLPKSPPESYMAKSQSARGSTNGTALAEHDREAVDEWQKSIEMWTQAHKDE